MLVPSLVLASGSPRRAALLRSAGFAFEVSVPAVDERPFPGEDAAAMVERLAAVKANAVGRLEAAVIGADTTVVLDGAVLGKPADPDDAMSMLASLAGRSHVVLTGWAVLLGERIASGVERSVVHMREIEEAELRAYVESGEPMDKAGAYAVQEEGGRFVVRVEGSRTNVMGLPMEAVTAALGRFGISPASPQ